MPTFPDLVDDSAGNLKTKIVVLYGILFAFNFAAWAQLRLTIVNGKMPVRKDISSHMEFEDGVLAALPQISKVLVHIEPARRINN